MRDEPTRRWVLAGTAGVAAALAGCGSNDSSGDGGSADGSDETNSAGDGGAAPTDSPSESTSTPAIPDIEPWEFFNGDAGASSGIEGSVPTDDPEVVWTGGDSLNTQPIYSPVFNDDLVFLSYTLREENTLVDHAGNVSFTHELPAIERYAQPDGFLVETQGLPVVKLTNAGERAWVRGPDHGGEYEPHPEPDVLSFKRSFTNDDDRKTGEVGVYDFAAEEHRWREQFPLERAHGGADEPVEYRAGDLFIDTERGVLVHTVRLAEGPPDDERHGTVVARDLATGAEQWRLDGVNRRVGNIAGGRVLTAGISWGSESSEPVDQYLRSYHTTTIDGGSDGTLLTRDDGPGDQLFQESGLAFDDQHYFLDGDRLYATTTDNTALVALSVPDATEQWRHETAGEVECRPRFADNAVVLGTSDGVELVGHDGERRAVVDVDTSFDGGIMLTPGRIYAAGKVLHAIQ